MIPREPEESLTDSNEAATETPEKDVVALEQALAEEKEKASSHLANWQRSQADFINYKRRSEQEKEEIRKFANSALILNVLPVLDDLERAFASIPPKLDKLSWVEGIRLIERKLRNSLETLGLSPIEAMGKPFDPKFHQAAMHRKGREGIVIEELQKGYKLHDRVLRPVTVVVGNGETEEEEGVKQEDNN